jgi:TRAP-type C4-dicarboxylate transport system substrate-binding protein
MTSRRFATLGVGLAVAALALAVSRPAPARAQTTVVKLATLVPDGSVWDKILRNMGDQWSKETQGRVTLRIYPGGVAGDEPDIVRKMRIGQIQAAALTATGLAAMDPAFNIFGIPNFFASYDELFGVLARMEPTLRAKLEAKGFVMLNWGHGGWVYFFSKQPLHTVEDLKKAKMFAWAGDDKQVELWKSNGFRVVPLAVTDVLTGLQSGLIEAYPTTPLAALSMQWFRTTPYMLEMALGPLVGALVINKATWNKISEADRAHLMEACRRAEQRLDTEVPKQDSSSVTEMVKRGLKIVKLTPADAADWRKAADTFAGSVRGAMVPADILDLAERERAAYRKTHPVGAR